MAVLTITDDLGVEHEIGGSADPNAVTAAAVLADHAILRGAGGVRGAQDSTAGIADNGVMSVPGIGDGGYTNYDLNVGGASYGMIRFGNAAIGRTSFKSGAIDLDGAILIRNIGGPATSEIEFIVVESAGGTCRLAIPKSGVGNATYHPRSFIVIGPAPADTDFVKISYWQALGWFHNLACDTAGSGADFGVQNDLEVEGNIYVDDILESTTGAGVTIEAATLKDDRLGIGITSPQTSLHIHELSGTNPRIFFTNASIGQVEGTDGFQIGLDASGHGFIWSYDTNLDIRFGVGGFDRMRITDHGVGIGYAVPQANLVVADINVDSDAFMLFQNDSTLFTATDGLYVGIDADELGKIWHYENKDLVFGTNNTERVRIESSGNVLFLGTILIDGIVERTGAAGVTIESVLLKDGLVGGRDMAGLVAGPGSAIDGNLAVFDGTGGELVKDGGAPGGGGGDPDAIHDNVAAEISAITEKTTPVAADLLVIEDSAASNAKKRVQIGNLPIAGEQINSGTLPIARIGANAVTLAKIVQATATDKVLLRSSGGAGNWEEGTLTAAGRALIDDADAAAQRTTLNLDSIGARVYNSLNISIATATQTALTFDSERWDTDGIHHTSIDHGRLTCKTAGVYSIEGNIRWTRHSTDRTLRTIGIKLNGSTFIALDYRNSLDINGVDMQVSISTLYKLIVNEFVELVVRQDSGGNLDIMSSGNFSPEFSMEMVSQT